MKYKYFLVFALAFAMTMGEIHAQTVRIYKKEELAPLMRYTKLKTAFEAATFVQRFDLSLHELITLEGEFNKFTECVELNINENKLSTLPVSIGDMKKLQYFWALHNLLTALPQSIGNCEYMQEMDVSFNQIMRLPEGICKLKDLKIFRANSNQLQSMPEDIGDLTQLKELNLGINAIQFFPDSFINLKSLEILVLSHNYFARLPDSISKLENV